MQNAFQGSLFTTGYLTTSIVQSPEWSDLGDRSLPPWKLASAPSSNASPRSSLQ